MTEVLRSRFIASLEYAETQAEARAFLARIRAEFPDASHNVSAFAIGAGNSRTESCSDDGEPAGTSGRPLLAALRGSGLGNAALVVTRYFGGTLLGTGGLARAYAEAGKAVLAVTARAELAEFDRLRLALPYRFVDPVRHAAIEAGAVIESEDFAESVTMTLEIPSRAREAFSLRLATLSSGAIAPEFLETRTGRAPV